MWKSPLYADRPQRMALVVIVLLVLGLTLALGACDIPDPFVASSHSSGGSGVLSSTTAPWPTFTDRGNDGFTISYPPSWKAMISGFNDGFFSNAATGTTMEVRVTTVPQPPAEVLAQAQQTPTFPGQPPHTSTVTQRTIAGHPAVDVFTPYYLVPTPVVPIHNGGTPGIAGGRVISMAATNSAGTTNVYAFVVNYALDSAANITPASLTDNPVILQMVSTFQLPATIGPALTQR